ncbi:hypothetical protein [Modestobacter sp. VKM Ac-2984]|uniref:hypothetical protein n=1 Tax=Modestobacter sp. VKM Ac-2984 TaxID=3004138 RepID=UPI0022AA5B18|nr:hypothetical protein [Modestobacter sp. VKM Ac-2984]MCZ2818177.1 hypothetical protein [Modestobacter sp. VKM Ac-2984]
MRHEDDPAEYARRIEAKLSPDHIRATLAFSGLYQLTHEQIKRTVLDDVKSFFGYSPLRDGMWLLGESGKRDYDASVLSRAPKRPFQASLLWLEDMEAITTEQRKRLDAIYAHRHDLTHELVRYLVDVDTEPDVDLFQEALEILLSIHQSGFRWRRT